MVNRDWRENEERTHEGLPSCEGVCEMIKDEARAWKGEVGILSEGEMLEIGDV